MQRPEDQSSSSPVFQVPGFRWAEFDLSGRFIGGASGVGRSDPLVELLSRRAAAGDVDAGHLEWVAGSECFLWYLPIRFHDDGSRTDIRLRGIAVDFNLFAEVTGLFNSAANLTLAETRTLFQLVAGINLRSAARLDKVAYETKRSHLKSAAEKLGCVGQKDLLRKIMGQLFHLMSADDAGAERMPIVPPAGGGPG